MSKRPASRTTHAASPAHERNVDARTLLAYHEAGHAVLSAALADMPRHVTIRPNGPTLGHAKALRSFKPWKQVQIILGGHAAEHLVTGRRPRELDREVGFAILAGEHPDVADAFVGSEHTDGARAVEEVRRMGILDGTEETKREVDRFYDIARASLGSVWPSVKAIAAALMKHEELDRDGVEQVLLDVDLYTPVFAVQRANGLLPDESCTVA